MTNRTVLIIDDDARNIFALTATLRAKGYKCVSATSAEQGIDFLKSDDTVGLILLDMMMPEMDGYEALPIIKQVKPGMPTIAVTAQAMVGDREKCLQAGATDYLSKPVDVDKLMHILHKYLN